MIPTITGQIVKFRAPLQYEDANQQYVVLELHTDVDIPRAKIKALNTGLPFPPVSVVRLNDLEVVQVLTDDLVGLVAYIKKENGESVLGKITATKQSAILAEFILTQDVVETNVYVTVKDSNGYEHEGKLIVQ